MLSQILDVEIAFVVAVAPTPILHRAILRYSKSRSLWHCLCSKSRRAEVFTMQLKEVMARHVEMVRPENTLVEAARKMKDLNVGPIPVCDDSEIVGMITDRDITTRAVGEGFYPART